MGVLEARVFHVEQMCRRSIPSAQLFHGGTILARDRCQVFGAGAGAQSFKPIRPMLDLPCAHQQQPAQGTRDGNRFTPFPSTNLLNLL